MLRWLLFLLLFPIYSIFLNLFARCCHSCSWFNYRYQRLVQLWNCWILWTINIKIVIDPADIAKLRSNNSKIIICNHQSHLDSLILWAIMPKEVYLCFAAKKELFQIPIFGGILKYSGSIVIDRQNAQLAMQNLKDFFILENAPKTLVIYAEGTRGRENKLLPFKRGPFIVAKELLVPMLPVVIYGTANSLPSRGRWPRPATVMVKVLPTLTAEQLQAMDPMQVKNHMWNKMGEELLQMQALSK